MSIHTIHEGGGNVSVYCNFVLPEQDFEVDPGSAFYVHLMLKASATYSAIPAFFSNEFDAFRLVWSRLPYVQDRDTDNRVARTNP
ncbi:MAG: hypothetical protein OEU92_27765 [Alphaproteobacteria bacterium]|nr:hypothetical protein [Alphaproteobacteria bacterium]